MSAERPSFYAQQEQELVTALRQGFGDTGEDLLALAALEAAIDASEGEIS